MTRVHVLTEPPITQNTVAFLSPILWNAPLIRERGVQTKVRYAETSDLGSCDVVAINSKFWSGPWDRNRDRALRLLDKLKAARRRIVYFDRSSSAGQVNCDVLPTVDRYLKNALYADRTLYQRAVYGGRLFAEYYRDKYAIVDDDAPFVPPTLAADDVRRLGVGWNTGLANYSPFGPRLGTLYRSLPLRAFFAPPRRFTSPARSRPVPVSCRMSLSYKYQTVGYQRQKVAELLALPRGGRVSKLAYFRELRLSRVVASPFGYSEINYKDFETFLSGAVLLKPDMSHLETWPDFFQPHRTYVPHRWDLADLAEQVTEILRDHDRFIGVAVAGQEAYRHHVSTSAGRAEFANRFVAQVAAW